MTGCIRIVYESAPNFTERGTGIRLPRPPAGAFEALGEIIPSAIYFLKTHARAVEVDTARLVVIWTYIEFRGRGECLHPRSRSRRRHHNELWPPPTSASFPGDTLHAVKRVKSLKQTGFNVAVAFEDAIDAHFDAVIRPDGMFRSKPCLRLETARAALGDESFKVDLQYAWAW
ncbi:hypothetical protein K449DRAFT_469292 [Hypoxylon sp. EC38]|nr:hypothetical protein K449DRAFT_469292 [Hypoxylon sp. EC38]